MGPGLIQLPRCALLAIVLLTLGSSAAPIPIPPLDLDDLTRKAQLIVVGEVISLKEVGNTVIQVSSTEVSARVMQGELQVDAVLKGSMRLQSIALRFLEPDVFIGFRGIGVHTYRIFFLQESGDAWEFVNPYHPSVVAVRNIQSSGESAVVRVVNQVGAVLHSAGASEPEKLEATYVLRRSKSSAAIEALRGALGLKQRNVQLDAAAALLERNDISGLVLAENALLNLTDPGADYVLHNLVLG